jgi:2-desacetyl-2-hydroxyethyl bacteriochlorophyllide A dehydrogenase
MRYASVISPGKVIIQNMDIPSPGDNQMLVKVKACGVCGATDLHYIKGECEEPLPVNGFNSYFGHESSGVVEKVGSNVAEFKPGDRIAYLGPGYQEYAIVKPELAVKLPDDVDFAEGLAEPLSVVINTLDHAGVAKGEDVVVLGAGFMGLLLVDGLAKAGAGRIIVTDIDDYKLDVARKLGAGAVINSAKANPSEEIGKLVGDQGVRVVIEAAGVGATLAQAGEIAGPGGKVVVHGFYPKPMTINMVPWHAKELTIINSHPSSVAKYKTLMEQAMKSLQRGELNVKDLITHRLSLDEVVTLPQLLAGDKRLIKAVLEV